MTHVSPYAIVDAPNYGGRVPVDTTPGPVPVYRALKSQPLSSELHVTNFSAGATVGAHSSLHDDTRGTRTTLNCNCGNSAVVCTTRPAPVVAPQRACSSPCRRNATAEPPLFSAMLDQGTCVAQQRHVNLLVQEVWTGTSTSFLNCLEHERLSLHTTGITNLSKNSTWGISTESAQFALCVPAVLSARTAGASRCMKQRRQPPSKNCNSGNSTVFSTVWTNLTCQAQQRACQH